MKKFSWSTVRPSIADVVERHAREGQAPRWWWHDTKPDGHGNLVYVVELRVLGDVLHWKDPNTRRWEPLPEFGGEWAACESPST